MLKRAEKETKSRLLRLISLSLPLDQRPNLLCTEHNAYTYIHKINIKNEKKKKKERERNEEDKCSRRYEGVVWLNGEKGAESTSVKIGCKR